MRMSKGKLFNMKKTLFFTVLLFLLSCGCTLSAQNINRMVRELESPGAGSSGQVKVTHHGDVSETLNALQGNGQSGTIRGYRIRIFFDNSQSARELAYSTQSRFNTLFPDTPTYISYEAPYFKVSVGNCLTQEEAIILWGKVKGDFDRAFVIREDISIAEFTK